MPSLYTRLRAAADPLARSLGHYSAYTLRGERIGVTGHTRRAAEAALRERGYEPSPLGLEAAKQHPDDGRLHVLALRRVDPDHPRRQYHVHGFTHPDGIELHSHYELRADPWPVGGGSWGDVRGRLRDHYRAEWGATWGDGVTYIPGGVDDRVPELVHA